MSQYCMQKKKASGWSERLACQRGLLGKGAESREKRTYDRDVVTGAIALVTDLALERFVCNAFRELSE